ncbi:DUF423 domain-containing protein [Pseudomaricurvus sp. HS19]|uniref:DUF423 domain-containing protein n=1 Tax=Pseudomaricurvus sp. HS19 TaxID=2692626 RepID=UPI00136D45F8|nr:DUF423 domain-containing protein [Pseudomaricurvus sp. HS19]MYM63711.1 DUF423 domain-containing protein [Pseudomaricurvus sp. HS19]
MARMFVALAAASGLLAVVLGAFGAHGLKGKLPEAMLNAYSTGVQYHFYHTLALLLVALLLQRLTSVWLLWSGWLFVAGMLLFSGSLYALALGAPRWLGPVTPIGGLCFMAGWLCLFIGAWRTDG